MILRDPGNTIVLNVLLLSGVSISSLPGLTLGPTNDGCIGAVLMASG